MVCGLWVGGSFVRSFVGLLGRSLVALIEVVVGLVW